VDRKPLPGTFDHYQEIAETTAVYPAAVGAITEEVRAQNCLRILYAACGLAGEAGEAANKVKKIVRDDAGIITEAKRGQIADEIGGVLWYCAMIAEELELELSEIAEHNLGALMRRAQAGTIQGEGDDR
jgi:NTP pyrophosphatase (non-canonical NTP hydrolase)